MRTRVGLCLHSVLRNSLSAFRCDAQDTQCRGFIDAPVVDGTVGSSTMAPTPVPPETGSPGGSTPNDVGSSYVHPLDVSHASFKLYGESTTFANDNASRVFSSAGVLSYDPALLFSDLRLQEYHHKAISLAGSLGATDSADPSMAARASETEFQPTEDEENDAVMRSGRNKQGAAGAAAMAAAMLDSRRAADGIAMVPGHPLPVVFPRQDGQQSTTRLIKNIGPDGARQGHANRRARQTKKNSEEGVDTTAYKEFLDHQHLDSLCLEQGIVMRVQVLDEHRKPTPVSFFRYFHDAALELPAEVLQRLKESGFVHPTLLQSAIIPYMMRGRDVVAISQGGSNTRVAYTVPSIALLVKVKTTEMHQHTERAENNRDSALPLPEPSEVPVASSGDVVAHPIVVILCDTRPAVLQTAALYRSLAPEGVRLAAAYRLCCDNDKNEKGVGVEGKGCDVIVATPVTLSTLVSKGHVALDRVHMLVMDITNHSPTEQSSDSDSAMQHVEGILRRVHKNRMTPHFSLFCREAETSMESVFRKYTSPLTMTVVVTRGEHTNAYVQQESIPSVNP